MLSVSSGQYSSKSTLKAKLHPQHLSFSLPLSASVSLSKKAMLRPVLYSWSLYCRLKTKSWPGVKRRRNRGWISISFFCPTVDREVEKKKNLRIDKKEEDWREEGYDRNSTHELPSPLMVLSLKKTREKRGRERGRETPDIHLSFSISPDFCCFSLLFSLL